MHKYQRLTQFRKSVGQGFEFFQFRSDGTVPNVIGTEVCHSIAAHKQIVISALYNHSHDVLDSDPEVPAIFQEAWFTQGPPKSAEFVRQHDA